MKDESRPEPVAERSMRAFDLGDVRAVLEIGVGGLVAWIVPEQHWAAVAGGILNLTRPSKERLAAIDSVLVGQGFGNDSTTTWRAAQTVALESHFQLMREYRPGGWTPSSRLERADRLERALATGRGAVLWLPIVTQSALGSKLALHRAGYAVNHVGHERHGFSETRFGIRFLNPIRTRIEDRYLKRRLMLSEEDSTTALRASLRLLRGNEIVSITAGGRGASMTVDVLGTSWRIAIGAPTLTYLANSTLLPAFPYIDEAGTIGMAIEEPLARRDQESKQAFVRRSLLAFSEILDAYIRKWPEQWRGWAYLPSTALEPPSEPACSNPAGSTDANPRAG